VTYVATGIVAYALTFVLLQRREPNTVSGEP
jgi:hypothetical protein